jgi:ankyrin repeat protein
LPRTCTPFALRSTRWMSLRHERCWWPGLAWRARWPGAEVTFAQNIADRCVWYRPRCRELVLLLAAYGAELDIHTAARAGVLDEVQRLVASEPPLRDRLDSLGRTPLYRASNIYGALEEARKVAHWLLAQGAEVDLSSACSLVLVDQVRRSLATDPHAASRPDCMGVPPLAWAVRPHRICDEAVAIVKSLLEAGANPQGRDPTFKTGMQPLHHLAEWCGAPGQLDLLLAAGADINAHDDNGWTPLDYARDRKRNMFVDLLLTRGARTGARGEKVPIR